MAINELNEALQVSALEAEEKRILEKAEDLYKQDVVMHDRLIQKLEEQLKDAREALAKMDLEVYIERERTRARNFNANNGLRDCERLGFTFTYA